jgi:hypothetical protein
LNSRGRLQPPKHLRYAHARRRLMRKNHFGVGESPLKESHERHLMLPASDHTF